MKRWWVVPVVGCVIVLATTVALLSPRDDGLDWIRAYGGRENRWLRPETEPGSYWTAHQFIFTTVPPGLELELISRVDSSETQKPGLLHATLMDGWLVSFNASERTLFIDRYVEPNWFERQWFAFKRFLGMFNSSPPNPLKGA